MVLTACRVAVQPSALVSAGRRYIAPSAPVVNSLRSTPKRLLTSSPLLQPPRVASSAVPPQPKSSHDFSSFASSSSGADVEQKAQATYTYALAAAYTAKDVPFNPVRHTTTFQPASTPPSANRRRLPRSQRPASGQDAYFISQHKNAQTSFAFGVADGVGGWADSGVDPADFSHAFCENMAANYSLKGSKAFSAQSLMQKGYDDVLHDSSIKAGGSTACVAIASPKGEVEVANLGDSGFLHIRTGAIRHASEAQIHAFNTPYQLAVIPEAMRRRTQAFGGTQLADMPRDSAVSRHSLKHGDVLVFATDGVWDNLSSSEVLRTVGQIMVTASAWEDTGKGISVTPHLPELTEVKAEDVNQEAVEAGQFDGKIGGRRNTEGIKGLQGYLAAAVAGQAKVASENNKRDGPFAREVQKYYPEEMWRGGKVDDICVVVAVVVEEGKGLEGVEGIQAKL